MPTPSPFSQAALDECLRQGAAIAAHEDAPCGVYTSSILKSLGLTFQGLVMAVSVAFAVVTFIANSGAAKSQFLVKMRSRMNLPFFLGAAIAYGSLIFIYQGPVTGTIIVAYWMREIGFAVHYGAIFLKIISELRYRPMLRLERISAASASTAGANIGNSAAAGAGDDNATGNLSNSASHLTGTSNRNNNVALKPVNATMSSLPSTQISTQQAWMRASNKLNQTRLNKSSILNYVYLLLVPVVALSVWTAAFASLPPGAARRALCFTQPWSYVIEAFELTFIAFNFALSVRIVHKGGQSPRMYGPLFEIKLFKLLAVLLANEFMFSTGFYLLRHAAAMKATSDMMALAHLLRDNLTITVNLMAIFIFKVAIRGGQMGSRTNLSGKSVTATRMSSTAHANRPQSSAASVLSGPHHHPIYAGSVGDHEDGAAAGLLATGSRGGSRVADIDEATEAAQCIEIAELKKELRRVQMQAEYYRVKAMRKDNPHLNSSSCGKSTSPSASKKPISESAKRSVASTDDQHRQQTAASAAPSSHHQPASTSSQQPSAAATAPAAHRRPNDATNTNNNSNNNSANSASVLNNPSVLNRIPPAVVPVQSGGGSSRLEGALRGSHKMPSSTSSSSHRQ